MNAVIPSSSRPAPVNTAARGEAPESARSSFRRRGWGTLLTGGVIAATLIAPAAHPYAAVAVLIALSAWSLIGAKQAIQALSIAVVVKFLNPAIYPFEGPLGLFAWAMLALAGLRIFVDGARSRGPRHRVIRWLLLFGLVIGIESIFFSHASLVSVFKAASFTYMAAAALIGLWVTSRRGVDWESWFVALWIAVVALSIPTLLVRDIAFHTNGLGFQGILNHPQAFGVFMAPALAWIAGKLVLARRPSPLWLYAALPSALVLVYLTAARTALVAVASGALAVFIASFFGRRDWRIAIRQGVLRPVSLVLALAMVTLLLLKTDAVLEMASGFARKDQSQIVSESFETSRGRAIAEQWSHFTENPLFGIGFGVSLDPAFEPVIDPITGLPLSAPVEKGFLPTAILEETGAVGVMFFALFVFSAIRLVIRRGDIVLAWLFFTCLFVNIGEMVFFSAGGLGLYIWLLMAWAASSTVERKRDA